MTRMYRYCLATAAAACFGLGLGQANAETPGPIELASYGADCDTSACVSQDVCDCSTPCGSLFCDSNPCQSGGFVFEAETLFFKYNRADGTRVGDEAGEDVDWDRDIAPRLTLGYVGDSGLGFRTRFFEFDHTESATAGGNQNLSVDTYTIDLEAFERFALTRCWDVELSGGLRYNEFDELMRDNDEDRINSFTGWGGIVGMEASRTLGRWGGLYGRVRQSILVDDKFVLNENGAVESELLRDSVVGATELALGWEYRRALAGNSLLTFRSGYEWQNWQNYSSSFAGPVSVAAGIEGEEIFTGPADVGFDGFTLSLALDY